MKQIMLHNFWAKQKKLYGLSSTASRLKPFQGDSLLFTTKFPEIHGTYFIDLGKTKD